MSDLEKVIASIEKKILVIRSEKVMLDKDLAVLYGVENRVLIQAVKRNIERFPEDFMFQLDEGEFESLRSQIVISNRGGRRYLPYAFTEQGVAMLSSVLRSKRAVLVNVEIMRAFVRLRHIFEGNTQLRKEIDELETKYDDQFKIIFEVIHQLMSHPEPKRKPAGFAPWLENHVGGEGGKNMDRD